ncbi:AAA family ATPase [Brucellaceae bacterium C25G]
MIKIQNNCVVLTGGPGAGKTSLTLELQKHGYQCSEEAGRGIIQSQNIIKGPFLPWLDPAGFAEQMLGWEMRSWHMAEHTKKHVFFDRGIPDIIGYLRLNNLPIPTHILNAAQQYRYNKTVFILPPWPEIYKQDEERKQTFNIAISTYEAMIKAYHEFNYEIIEVPRDCIENRAAFILDKTAYLT